MIQQDNLTCYIRNISMYLAIYELSQSHIWQMSLHCKCMQETRNIKEWLTSISYIYANKNSKLDLLMQYVTHG